MNLSFFPIINASLNGASAILLVLAFGFVKTRRFTAHAVTMIAALITSVVFLGFYLTYHYLRARQGIGLTQFPESALRPYYLVLLASHTILAMLILPLIGITLWWAAHRKWARHRQIAVWALPLWFYVSVTGVLVYWMLYHVAPRLRH